MSERPPAPSLDELIETGWRPTEADAYDIAQGVLTAVASFKSLRPPLSHGNISPSSVLASRAVPEDAPRGGGVPAGNWRVWLTNFGGEGNLGNGDVRDAGVVLLYLLTGKEEQDFEWGRGGVLPAGIAASPPMRELLALLLQPGAWARNDVRGAEQALAMLRTAREGPARPGLSAGQGLRAHARPAGTRVTLTLTGELQPSLVVLCVFSPRNADLCFRMGRMLILLSRVHLADPLMPG